MNHFPKWPLSSFLIHPIENRNSIAAGTLFQKKWKIWRKKKWKKLKHTDLIVLIKAKATLSPLLTFPTKKPQSYLYELNQLKQHFKEAKRAHLFSTNRTKRRTLTIFHRFSDRDLVSDRPRCRVLLEGCFYVTPSTTFRLFSYRSVSQPRRRLIIWLKSVKLHQQNVSSLCKHHWPRLGLWDDPDLCKSVWPCGKPLCQNAWTNQNSGGRRFS